MHYGFINLPDRRILVVAGHYGSGKTEFCVSLAIALADCGMLPYKKIAVVDLDVVNPYFRSRERKDLLGRHGVSLYGGIYGSGSTAELPELSASVRAPLEDDGCYTIVDLGGNDAGARILRQFGKYFTGGRHALAAVINPNRPETSSIDGAEEHIRDIEYALGIKTDGLIGNAHLLRHTDAVTIADGYRFTSDLSEKTGIPLLCQCYPSPLVSKSDAEAAAVGTPLMPFGMYMTESWQDKYTDRHII